MNREYRIELDCRYGYRFQLWEQHRAGGELVESFWRQPLVGSDDFAEFMRQVAIVLQPVNVCQ